MARAIDYLGTKFFEIPDDLVASIEDVGSFRVFTYGMLRLKMDLLGAAASKFYFVQLRVNSSPAISRDPHQFELYESEARAVKVVKVALFDVVFPELGFLEDETVNRLLELDRLWEEKNYIPKEDTKSHLRYDEVIAFLEHGQQ